jgi:N-methylhydantoinase B
VMIPEHLSKDQGIPMKAGDRVEVMTPGGGGYGDPLKRDLEAVLNDYRMGYYTADEIRDRFAVAIAPDGTADKAGTDRLRGQSRLTA